MNEILALELARRKMQELKVGNKYLLRYRHLQLCPSEQIVLDGEDDTMILLTEHHSVRVISRTGIYDMQDKNNNEMQYVHSGSVLVKNLCTKRHLHIKFLQVIPTHQKPINHGRS